MDECFTSVARAARDTRQATGNVLSATLQKLAGGRGILLRHEERPWASITFAGSRHSFTFRFSGDDAMPAGEAFIAQLPDHEFAILGQLVADATVTAVRHDVLPEPVMEVECELLLLDD